MKKNQHRSPNDSLKDIKSFLFIAAGTSISTANVSMSHLSGALIKIAALAFVCFLLFITYQKASDIAKQIK